MAGKDRPTPPRKRHHAFYATTDGVVDSITVVTNAATGAMEIVEADPESYRSVIFHERDSGKDKFLLDARASSHLNAFDANAQFMGTFRYALAVDTNMRPNDGFALACVFVVPGPMVPNAEKVRLEFLNAFVIVEPSPSASTERIGWHLTLQNNILPARLDPRHRVALVTDSDLGDLPNINARRVPYYDRWTLPRNVSLVYASADKPTDTIPSALIRACDTHAKGIADLARAHRGVPLREGDANYRGWYRIGTR